MNTSPHRLSILGTPNSFLRLQRSAGNRSIQQLMCDNSGLDSGVPASSSGEDNHQGVTVQTSPAPMRHSAARIASETLERDFALHSSAGMPLSFRGGQSQIKSVKSYIPCKHQAVASSNIVVQRVQRRRPALLMSADTFILGRKDIRLFGATTPIKKNWDILKPTFSPLANGTFIVNGIPVAYGLSGQANAKSSASLTFGPGNLENIRIFVTGPEAARMKRMRQPWINPTTGYTDFLLHGPAALLAVPTAHLMSRPWNPEPKGSFEGDAMLRFRASASAYASASARLDAHLGVFGDALNAGAFAGLSASAQATAPTTVDTYVLLTYTQGNVQITSVLDLAAALNLNFSLNAFAGVWVELRLPEIPVVTALSHEVQDWPIVGWIAPDLSKLRWRKEYRKEWPVFNNTYQWNMSQRFTVGNGTATGAMPDAQGFAIDELLHDAQEKQREGTLKDDPTGPGDQRRNSDPIAVSAAKSAALAQISSANGAVMREKKENSRLLRRARQAAGSSKSASVSGRTPALAIGSSGGDPVVKVEERAKKLDQATHATKQLRERADALKEPATAPDGVSRNEARSGYESIAANADALGDKIDRGEQGFAVPAVFESSDVEYEKMQEARQRAYSAFDEAFDLVRTEKLYADDQVRKSGENADLSVYRHAVQKYQRRAGLLWNRVQKLEDNLENARDFYERHEHALGSIVFQEQVDIANRLLLEAVGMNSDRPVGNWDLEYVELLDGYLILKPTYRGKTIRSAFYPHDYSADTKERMIRSIGSFRADDNGNPYWYYSGKKSARGDHWWLLDDGKEKPTLDHTNPTVRAHWNRTGRTTTYDERKLFYDFRGKGLIVVPQTLNSLDGANQGGTVTPRVTIGFRGAKK